MQGLVCCQLTSPKPGCAGLTDALTVSHADTTGPGGMTWATRGILPRVESKIHRRWLMPRA